MILGTTFARPTMKTQLSNNKIIEDQDGNQENIDQKSYLVLINTTIAGDDASMVFTPAGENALADS